MDVMQWTDALQYLCKQYFEKYWVKIWDELKRNPELKQTIPAFLVNPEKIILYIGKTHIALEYTGHIKTKELQSVVQSNLQMFDYTQSEDFMADILGFQYDNTSGVRIPIIGLVESLWAPSMKAQDILHENNWTFGIQPMNMSINGAGFDIPEHYFARFINCYFYGADDNGLIARHIKWMDIFPAELIDVDEERDDYKVWFWPQGIEEKAEEDAHYVFPEPTDFQSSKLLKLNKFVELFSSSNVDEPKITRFLSKPENQFIVKMVFFAKNIYAERSCEWADNDRASIKPDFLVELPSGYADIVEFKLPTIKSTLVVGTSNRETFSAEIHSYIAQTRVYSEYFNDPRNRKYVEERYGVKILHPKRWLVIGRRWMFSTDEWKSIENEFKDFAIRTYDDIVDGVRSLMFT